MASALPARIRLLAESALSARLARLHPRIIDLSLERILRLLAALGDPHLNLAPVVHVAGTNGKGSVIAFLRAMLEAAGYRVHAYTSPHLVRFNERIRLAGALIDDEALNALIEDCETANAGQPITFFEITTAVALLGFQRSPADIVLLETGLGGRLDATNVVDRPALTILTPISRDHESYLGDDIAAIAGEKAAIMKPGAICISAEQPPAAAAVVARRAADLGVRLCLAGSDFSARRQGDDLAFADAQGREILPPPALYGEFQVANAGLAIAAARALEGFDVAAPALASGLKNATWPGRLQRLTEGPLAASLPGGWQLWVDGGHNPDAARALAAQARAWAEKPLHLVVGMLASKNLEAFLAPLTPHAESLTAVAIPGEENAIDAKTIAGAAAKLGFRSATAGSTAEALSAITAGNRAAGRILVCGSLYLVGDILT